MMHRPWRSRLLHGTHQQRQLRAPLALAAEPRALQERAEGLDVVRGDRELELERAHERVDDGLHPAGVCVSEPAGSEKGQGQGRTR